MTSVTDELIQIHNLYMLQAELFSVLEAKKLDEQSIKAARRNLRNFSSILESVSHECMGGEDVYESLLEFRAKVNARLKNVALQTKKQKVLVN